MRILRLLNNLRYEAKWLSQRLTRGFDDRDLFSLDYTITKFALPRLRVFAKYVDGYPSYLESIDAWQEVLNKIIAAMELYERSMNNKTCFCTTQEQDKLIEEGYDLFFEHFFSLWN